MTTNVTIPREELEKLLAKAEAADTAVTTEAEEADPLLERARLAARSKSTAVKDAVSKVMADLKVA